MTNETKRLIIGRSGDQPFKITDQTVSRKHLQLTVNPDGTIVIEDLESTGTYIDNVRISKMTVTPDTIVRMGPAYTFRVKDALSPKTSVVQVSDDTPVRDDAAKRQQDIIRQFESLEAVWDKYQKEKIELQKNNAIKQCLRYLPMFILGALGYLITCIPELADYRTAITISGVAVGAVITLLSLKSASKLPEQMEKLNQQLQIDYVCPKCKMFLGFTPYIGIRNRGQCINGACKAKFVKS